MTDDDSIEQEGVPPGPHGGAEALKAFNRSATPSGGAEETPDLAEGIAAIKAAAKTIPGAPGVYRMLDAKGEVLYVGKARNLKRRVLSYTQPTRLETRKLRMVAQTRSMVVITTNTEAEALLLEANLIKRYRTRYNVLLRDDKSFPHILLRQDHDWPQITKHRGARRTKGRYFGPFASGVAVNQTLNTLQRVFLLRSCSDSVFDSRSRPCLLYQIKRCSAPCVDRISKHDYDNLVGDALAYLEGRDQSIQKDLAAQMQAAAEALDYERAASFRDRINALTHIQSRQDINLGGIADADAIAIAQKGAMSCVQVFFVRGGRNWGNRAFFPRHEKDATPEDVLSAFVSQFYENKTPAKLILLSHKVEEPALIAEALTMRAGRRIEIAAPQRGDKMRLMHMALKNAGDALDRKYAESATQNKLLAELADIFDLDGPPRRIEVYDNSHIMGANAVGAMIVSGPDGFEKNAYRKFNIKSQDLSPGDDYGMMREVMTRRFARLVKNEESAKPGSEGGGVGSTWPALLLIDGGAGQLSAVMESLAELGIADEMTVVGVSKGPDRNAGREIFHRPGREPFTLEPGNPVLYFLQRLRDEAHRFAISSHRARRSKALVKSMLDDIPGIGPKRKKALLHHFGSAMAVRQAGVGDLMAVEGISRQTAQQIYDHFHSEG